MWSVTPSKCHIRFALKFVSERERINTWREVCYAWLSKHARTSAPWLFSIRMFTERFNP
jgi:hypothetical protein